MDVTKMNKEILFTKEEIAEKILEMGLIIENDYKGKDLMVISLLKGSFVFTADLVRNIDLPLVIEFMITSSYGHGDQSTGEVNVI